MARQGKGPYGRNHKVDDMSRLFIGGKDTKPEVDAILAAIEARPGNSVSHDDVAKAAGLEAGSTRFQTVAQRWRKTVERNTAVRIESRERVFHFLSADEAHDRLRTDLHRIGKAAGKLHARAGAVDVQQLTGERKDAHFLLTRETAALLDSARRSAKAIQGPRPTKVANLRLAKS